MHVAGNMDSLASKFAPATATGLVIGNVAAAIGVTVDSATDYFGRNSFTRCGGAWDTANTYTLFGGVPADPFDATLL